MGGNKDVGSGSEDDEDDKKKCSGEEEGSDEEGTEKILVHCDPFLLAYTVHPCYSANIHICLQYCSPIRSLGVKTYPSNDEMSYLYAPATWDPFSKCYPPIFFTPVSLTCASSIYIRWWLWFCSRGVLCCSTSEYCSTAVLPSDTLNRLHGHPRARKDLFLW